MNVGSHRPGTDHDVTRLDESNKGDVKNESDDETIDTQSVDDGEQVESDQSPVFSAFTAQSKQSNAVSKPSVAGPSADRNKR